MGISLEKGQRISLAKADGGTLTRVIMGLGWDPVKSGGILGFGGRTEAIDLDASCICFDDAGNQVDAIWFRQLRSRDGSITHSGDNRTGDGDGDDEQISVDLSQVPANVKTLIFTVNSFIGQTFERVANATCRLVDATTGSEIARYNLTDVRGSYTGQIMAKLYRHNGEWKMRAIGEPAQGRTFQEMMPQLRTQL